MKQNRVAGWLYDNIALDFAKKYIGKHTRNEIAEQKAKAKAMGKDFDYCLFVTAYEFEKEIKWHTATAIADSRGCRNMNAIKAQLAMSMGATGFGFWAISLSV